MADEYDDQKEVAAFSEQILGVEYEEEPTISISEPFDPSKIRVHTEKKTIDLILRRVSHGEIDLAPEFQRRARLWPYFRRSQLIESLLLKIPLPVFYVAADHEDHWAVVDGLQRITTIVDFVSNRFPLKGLEYLSNLEDLYYKDLDRAMKRRIEETELVVNIIQPGTPDEVMMNIFKRINTGGIALNGQEIRNAINKGPARAFLQKLSTSEEFLNATDRSVNDKRMDAQELALRFIAFFTMKLNDKPKNLDNFLSMAMKSVNRMTEKECANLEAKFEASMRLSHKLFQNEAFRKPGTKKRNPINKALFESWSVNLAILSPIEAETLINKQTLLAENNKSIYEDDPVFIDSITSSTGHYPRILKRFTAINQLIKSTLNGVKL